MSNALNSMPVEPVDGEMAGGMDARGGQTAKVNHAHGRGSAASFKQLTAKLKGADPEAVPDVAGEVAARAAEHPPVPNSAADAPRTPASDLPKSATPTVKEEPPPEAELPPASDMLARPAGIDKPAAAHNNISQLKLPEFRPITWFDALPPLDAESDNVTFGLAPAVPTGDLPDDPEPITAEVPDIPVTREPAIETASEGPSGPEAAVEFPLEPMAEPEPVVADVAPAAPEPAFAEAPEVPFEPPPAIAGSAATPAEPAAAIADEPGPSAGPTQAIEEVATTPPDVGAESVSPADVISPADTATGADVAPLTSEAADRLQVDDGPQQSLDDAPAATLALEAEAEPVAAHHDVTAEIRAEAVEEIHEVFTASERAPLASPLAERVVEAMLKTISTAIYAKPSALERARFVREVAAVMREQGETYVPPVPAVQPPPKAAQPAPQSVQSPAQPARAAAEAVQSPAQAVEPPPAAAAVVDAPAAPPPPVAPEAPEDSNRPIADALASRMGPAASLLRATSGDEEDPFAQPAKPAALEEPKPAETEDADEATGELALTLLDMMSGGAGTALPHERALASDTLLRILPRIPVKQLQAVVERVAIMETPPALLVAKLIRDPRPEVLGPLLERCSHISDQDLMNAAPSGDPAKLRMMARRRVLSTVLSDYLIEIGEPHVLLTLIRNPGAAFSHDAFYRLAEHASKHHALLPPLATRADLPAPVAFELFWHVPQELRRFILSRFLTDSETLTKILRITLSTHNGEGDHLTGDVKFPPKAQIDGALENAVAFKLEKAAYQLSEIGAIGKDTALRILSDREGEPIAVLLKAMGYPRAKLEDMLERLREPEAGLLRPDRNPEELPAIFDGLSFNKARILLTYWDWFNRKAGPYAPHN